MHLKMTFEKWGPSCRSLNEFTWTVFQASNKGYDGPQLGPKMSDVSQAGIAETEGKQAGASEQLKAPCIQYGGLDNIH